MPRRVAVTAPSTAHVDRLRSHVRAVLAACGRPGVFVTDKSVVADLVGDDAPALAAASATLGLEVTACCRVWHLAEALADRERETAVEE